MLICCKKWNEALYGDFTIDAQDCDNFLKIYTILEIEGHLPPIIRNCLYKWMLLKGAFNVNLCLYGNYGEISRPK